MEANDVERTAAKLREAEAALAAAISPANQAVCGSFDRALEKVINYGDALLKHHLAVEKAKKEGT